ncbi:MAG: glycosyltransferase [Parasphingorhabdus sp.]|uniref:glycosyltransferase n=1 Tax=Parasphingorhabdus sp. TaxID=2709688 RepID=UPI003299EEFB
MTISEIDRYNKTGQKAEAGDTRRTIVYIGGFELPDKNAAAQRVITNAQIFQKLGYRVLLVGLSKNRQANGHLYPAESGESGLEAWEMGYPSNQVNWLRQILSDAPLRKLILLTDIANLHTVICYNHPAVSQWRIAHLARQHGALAVADCTEWYSKRHWGSVSGIVKNLDVMLRMHYVNWRMDGLITTSPFISGFYRSSRKPIVEIPTLMAPNRTEQTPIVDRSNGITRLFFAGTGFDKASASESADGMKDRLDWVFDVLHRAKLLGARFHMDLYGVDLDQYRELVPEQVTILDDMQDDLSFHGRQPRKLLLETLPKAAFSIFFRKETRTNLAGFPGKLSESISYGTPVITNPMPSSSQYLIEQQTCHLVEITDFDKAAAKIVELFAQSDSQVNAMKSYCYNSKVFHYQSFISPVEDWLYALEAS